MTELSQLNGRFLDEIVESDEKFVRAVKLSLKRKFHNSWSLSPYVSTHFHQLFILESDSVYTSLCRGFFSIISYFFFFLFYLIFYEIIFVYRCT